MVKWLVNIVMVGSLMALTPVRAPMDENYPQNAPSLPPAGRILSDILTEAFVNNNSNRDYQTNGPTATMLWAVFDEPIKGVYATMMFQNPPGVTGRHQLWNFFDMNTDQWVRPPIDPYKAVDRGGYGNLAVIPTDPYKYHPAFTAHMDAFTYRGDVWWPDIPFDPRNFSGQYVWVPGSDLNEVWPHIGFTQSGYLHKIAADYSGAIIGIPYATIYNRVPDLTNPAWDGWVGLENEGNAPWYGLFADPYGKTVVVTYYSENSQHIIMLIDTLEGEMFYAGGPAIISVDISQKIYDAGYTDYYLGFVGDGNPFVDKDGNIHLITFGCDGQTILCRIYHIFYNPRTEELIIHPIKTLTDVYYKVGINTLLAGRSQIGQERGVGTLYAIWEEFIQQPGRFVTSSTNDTFAPTRIVLAISKDNGATWTQQVLLESDQVPGSDNNDWLRFPVISPLIAHSGNLDLVYWGVYWDDDPGFYWQGQGGLSTVKMLVGRKEVGIKESISLKLGKTKFLSYGKNISFEIPYKTSFTLRVFDPSGREISRIFKGNAEGKHTLRLDKINSGIYFINLKTEKENLTHKVIVK